MTQIWYSILLTIINPFVQAMNTVMTTLQEVLRGTMTERVVNEAKTNGTSMVYYDDWLGNGDIDEHGDRVVKLFAELV